MACAARASSSCSGLKPCSSAGSAEPTPAPIPPAPPSKPCKPGPSVGTPVPCPRRGMDRSSAAEGPCRALAAAAAAAASRRLSRLAASTRRRRRLSRAVSSSAIGASCAGVRAGEVSVTSARRKLPVRGRWPRNFQRRLHMQQHRHELRIQTEFIPCWRTAINVTSYFPQCSRTGSSSVRRADDEEGAAVARLAGRTQDVVWWCGPRCNTHIRCRLGKAGCS
jgi:hypothetical protein